MNGPVRRRYEELAQSGELRADEYQRELADRLDALVAALCEHAQRAKKSSLGWFFARGARPEPPRGLYIWGAVGRGKTLLMDLFLRAAPLHSKRRVHFHAFMAETHERLDEIRRKLKSGELKGDDAIGPLADQIAAETRLLCFDEFAVYDIADAMILGRLFEQLFSRGVTVVATSNVAPEDLYGDGLNRPLFLPFIDVLRQHMTVFHLDAPRDFRLDSTGSQRRYVTPLGPDAERCLAAHFTHLTGAAGGRPREIASKGRRIEVPEAADGVARLKFEDLCARPLGAADYLKIAKVFHTIILADVPILGPENRNETKRLINLIDALYDSHTRLIVSAAAEPEELWQGGKGTEAFEFARTASRLVEMRSDAYWDAATSPEPSLEAARAC
jgi:cell division protein ZapE